MAPHGETHARPSEPREDPADGPGFLGLEDAAHAVELRVFTELSRGPEHFDALTQRLGLHPRSARDFLDALVALGLLKREGDRYGNTPETELFLDRKKPSYIGGILEMANARLYPFWDRLTEALSTEQPQNEIKAGGPGLFETLYTDPARLKEFLLAMTGISHGANLTIAGTFPWRDYHTFVDVGTAQGDLAAQVALANTHLRGLGFDLPEVAPIFEEYARATGVADRVAFALGNFFEQDLPKADIRLHGR